jgi:hypothetical protein
MLKQFQSTNTFGQVMNLYDAKPLDRSSNEKNVCIYINLYIKRGVLPTSLGRFNIHVTQGRNLVKTDLAIEGCLIEENFGSVMVIHMDCYDTSILLTPSSRHTEQQVSQKQQQIPMFLQQFSRVTSESTLECS